MTNDFSDYTVLLVVVNTSVTMDLLKPMLEQSGLQVSTAFSQEEVYSRLKTEEIDLILLDLLSDEVVGSELVNQLKTDPAYREIPIILLTVLRSSTDQNQGFDLGTDDFISPPFNKEELLVRIRHQLTLLETKRDLECRTSELKKVIAGRDSLYSVIAHDMRMPVSSIKMALNVVILNMEKKGFTDPEILEMLESCNEIAEELFTMLDNLLKWASSQTGKLKALPQQINLSELSEGIVEVFSMIAATKKIKLNFTSSPMGDTSVYVDIDMIKTSIRNLLSNAIKYSFSGSEIDVTVETKESDVIFSVIDRGCGISEENQGRLMHLTSHFTTFGTEHESGSGLGLLLVSEFMKLNNGRLFFQSKEGEGSTFGFAIPRKEM